MYIAIIIICIIWAIIAKNMAEAKGKDGGAWLLLGFLFGVIAIIILACAQNESKRPHNSFDLRESVYRTSEYQKPICMKCGNTLTKGPVCDMCGHTNTTSSFEKSSSPKEIPKVPKYKCKGCEETIDTLQCPWCGRKQYE